jgi:hypothetical protein
MVKCSSDELLTAVDSITTSIENLPRDHQRYRDLLRSWVQIPPGPLFPIVQLRYCFERVLNKYRTNSAGSLLLATKKASYYILEEVSLNTSVTLKHYS